jgi:hypothetical protein
MGFVTKAKKRLSWQHPHGKIRVIKNIKNRFQCGQKRSDGFLPLVAKSETVERLSRIVGKGRKKNVEYESNRNIFFSSFSYPIRFFAAFFTEPVITLTRTFLYMNL